MAKKVLLTSFDIWKPHHVSNSSDDLLTEILNRGLLPENAYYLRKLPVDFQLAPKEVISKIDELQPELILCCGMAEKRTLLTVESNGSHDGEIIKTSIDIADLVEGLAGTKVSHDAGNFVCNFLYYSVLKYIQEKRINAQCLFVHVPVLNSENLESILADFLLLTQKLVGSSEQTFSQIN
jgi:pyroglutamyl-peptidase